LIGTEPDVRPEMGERRAWGWVGHLRDGGTTAWQEWSTQHRPLGESQGRYLPGAQQLELLRRLNLAGRPSSGLCTQVLEASAAGRGRPDLELAGAGPGSEFGPAPVDPAELPAGELVRVAASVLADRLVDEPPAKPAEKRRASRWRRGFRVVGDPELADDLRGQLAARGRVPGGREPRILVVGTDLASMTAHAWTQRAFAEGVGSWREFLRLVTERGELPHRADLVAVARVWERRVGKERVHVVLDPAAVPRLAGERRRLAAPTYLPAEAGELARKVGSVLSLLVLPDEGERLLDSGLRPVVRRHALDLPGAGPLVVPAAHRDWLEAAAERMRRRLTRAGYAVHGDLDALVPRWTSSAEEATAPSPDATLDLAVRVLLDEGRTA
jgi:hypothetical protein